MASGVERDRAAVQLAAERVRLVRLCARLSGQSDAAEDLAQETILAAWRSLDRLDTLEHLSPWLSGIARNVCLNWRRRHYSEQRRLIDDDGDLSDFLAAPDPAQSVERYARQSLLEQALTLLPGDAARLLKEHYIEGQSQAALASSRGVSANSVAVKLHRGRVALTRVMFGPLRDQAAEHGLIPEQAGRWAETPVWCPDCGERRLMGLLDPNDGSGYFALRCLNCATHPSDVKVAFDVTQPYYARLLGSARTYKPALTRMQAAVAVIYRKAIEERAAPCLSCGRPAEIIYTATERDPRRGASRGLVLHCGRCGWASNSSLRGMVLALPEARRFWREHPRIHTLPSDEIEYEGADAILTRVRQVGGASGVDAIALHDTLQIIATHHVRDSLTVHSS